MGRTRRVSRPADSGAQFGEGLSPPLVASRHIDLCCQNRRSPFVDGAGTRQRAKADRKGWGRRWLARRQPGPGPTLAVAAGLADFAGALSPVVADLAGL